MPRLKVLPHAQLCPQGAEFDAPSGLSICDALLAAAEREAIDRQVAALAAVIATSDHRAIKQSGEALNRATEEFAGRRMDAGVKRALAGKRIANLDL